MSLTEDEIADMRVADLRKELSSRSLGIKGIKRILAARLLAAVKAESEEAEVAEEEVVAEEAEVVAEEAEVVAEEAEVAEEEAEVAEEEAEVAAEVAEEAEVAAEVTEEAEVAAEVTEEAEVAAEVTEEAEVAMEVTEEAEVAAVVEPVAPPSYVAQNVILSKLDAKDESELTTIEKDILAARERNEKFSVEQGEKTAFQISDDLRKKMRAQRFGPITTPAKSGRKRSANASRAEDEGAKKAKISTDVVVDDAEQTKRNARNERFSGQPGESAASVEATGQPVVATEETEATATEVAEE